MGAFQNQREEIDRQQVELLDAELARRTCNCGLVNPQVPASSHGATCEYRRICTEDKTAMETV